MVIGGIFKFNRWEHEEIPVSVHRGVTADIYIPPKLDDIPDIRAAITKVKNVELKIHILDEMKLSEESTFSNLLPKSIGLPLDQTSALCSFNIHLSTAIVYRYLRLLHSSILSTCQISSRFLHNESGVDSNSDQ